jgi:hypothetical protein
MTKFYLPKKLELDFLGDKWKGCYLEFNSITIRDLNEKVLGFTLKDKDNPVEVREAYLKTMGLLKDCYVKGEGIDEKGNRVPIDKEDLVNLPPEVLTKSINFLVGSPQEKNQ